MGLNKNLVYIALIDLTAALLAVLGLMAVFTGYCISKPRLFPLQYAVRARLHLDLLPPLAILVGSVHAIAGFSLWLTRVKKGVDLYTWIFGVALTGYLIYISMAET